MKNKFLCLSILVLSLFACKEEKQEDAALAVVSEDQKIDSLAMRYLELGRFSGSILVAKNDSVIFYKNYGLADYEAGKEFAEHTAFKIGSFTEFYTEAIFVDLVEKNEVNVEDKVSTHLPAIKGNYTIRELLTHTSGLPGIKEIKEQNPEVNYSTISFANLATLDPEKSASRSNLGYNILGLLLEKLKKKSFEEILGEYSKAWELKNTFYKDREAENIAKGYLFRNYKGAEMELLEAPKYDPEEAFSSNGIKSGIFDVLKLTRISKRATIEQNDYLQNDGFSYAVSKDEQAGLIVVVLSNRRHPVAREIILAIRSIYKGAPYEIPLPRKEVAVNTDSFEEYAGTYILNPRMKLSIQNTNDSLFILMGPNKIHLKPQSETQFYMEESDAAIEFIPNPNNTVSKAILYDGFLSGTEIFKVNN